MRQLPSLSNLLTVLGPGLFLIAYNVGTGTVTTMASAGSRWGVSLSWTVVLSCLFTYVGILLFGKYTLVTGDTILYALRRQGRTGNTVSVVMMAALILAEYAGIAGLMAIIVDLLQEWIHVATGSRGPVIRLLVTLFVLALLMRALWAGTYPRLERLMAIMVGLMGASFLATAVLVVPSWREIVAGLLPAVPDGPNADLIVAGMAGTTFSTALFFARSITMKAKGWTVANLGQARLDAAVSMTALLVLSMAVMICAAGTLYSQGHPVEEALDMVRTLEPLAGRFAISLFIVGIVAAGISSLIPTILIAPWLVSDYTNQPINPRSGASRIFVVGAVLIGLLAPFIPASVAKPVFLMIITMALLAIVSPISMVAIAVLLNQVERMGAHKNTKIENLACLGAVLFSFVISYFGVVGLIEYVQ